MNNFPLLLPRINILFVGDNVGRLKDISFELQRAWCSIIWDTKGLDGIRTAKLEAPDLIICETELPDISGLDVCLRVRAESVSREIPFILVNDIYEPGAELDALEAGADEYFSLPKDSARLLSRVFWLVEGGLAKPGSIGYYNTLRTRQVQLSRIMDETSDLLQNLDRTNSHVGLGRRRVPELEYDIHSRIDLGMHLIGVAADLFEEEALELDLAESFSGLAR